MKYLANAFSLQMINMKKRKTDIQTIPLTKEDFITQLKSKDFKSIIGHEDMANVLSSILKMSIKVNRTSIILSPGDILFVAQLTGGRLPVGVTALPEGFFLDFIKVFIK